MKAIRVFLCITIAMFLFLACKKKYECTCWIVYKDGTVYESSSTITSTQKNAQTECNATTMKPDSAVSKDCTIK